MTIQITKPCWTHYTGTKRPASNLSLTKELKIYDGEIAASSTKTAGKTG
jgi:hypothetical protein